MLYCVTVLSVAICMKQTIHRYEPLYNKIRIHGYIPLRRSIIVLYNTIVESVYDPSRFPSVTKYPTSDMDKDQSTEAEGEFPWQLGVFDAHCHPTDTISSIDVIPTMKARALVIMASRAQDQEIVAKFADACGVRSLAVSDLLKVGATKVVPSFGWHPWFSHQIYDDYLLPLTDSPNGSSKLDHYKSVIVPSPDDVEFLSRLPNPRSLSAYIAKTRSYLIKYPFALVGEIGIDRTFRIPQPDAPSASHSEGLTPGGREGKNLTPYRVDMDHQKKIFKAQLNLAGELSRPVSVHGVGAHGTLFEALRENWRGYEKPILSRSARKIASTAQSYVNQDENESEKEELDKDMKKPFPPRICLHSYSGPQAILKQYLHPSIPCTIFFSFSSLVNLAASASSASGLVSPKAIDIIKAVPDDRILVESDLHCAGERMEGLLEHVVKVVCQTKNWPLEKGVRQLASNWVHFVAGQAESIDAE